MAFLYPRKKHATIATPNASFSPEKSYEGGKNNDGEDLSGSPVVDLSGVDEKVAAGDSRSSKFDCSNGVRNDDVAANYEEMVNGDVKKTGKSVQADDTKESDPLNSSRKTKMRSKSNVSKVPHHPPNLNSNKDHRRSGLSRDVDPKDASRRNGGEKSPPFFDDELDENSDAGISAAALKKALEQAQKSISIAKMIKERKKNKGLQNGSKPSCLEVKGNKETKDGNFGEIFDELNKKEEMEKKSGNVTIIEETNSPIRRSEGNRDKFEFHEAAFEKSIGVNHEDKLLEDESSLKRAIEIHNADKIGKQSSPEIDPSNNKAAKFDLTNIKAKLEQTSTHESQERGENAKKTTKTEIRVEKDRDMENKEKQTKENEHKFDTNDLQQRIEAIKRGREREKDRKAVERAIREARERAFAEARERAMEEARDKLQKASIEAKVKAERTAVERATAEARERALEKAISQRDNGLKHAFSSYDVDKADRDGSESAQRRKARLERHQRIMDRAAKALAEKNRRDLLVQKEQDERDRLSQSLDAEIKRWATGKEANIRALLSTLQYILGRESGWKAITLTEMITSVAVKKAYRKATLYLHPDKVQQRGANVRQKYICEKVFDLLKAAWNRFNSEEM